MTAKPNIVFILGDDVGVWNISAYHRGMMGGRTPNIDKLAARGIINVVLGGKKIGVIAGTECVPWPRVCGVMGKQFSPKPVQQCSAAGEPFALAIAVNLSV